MRRRERPCADGWDDVDELELATLSWVHGFNHERLHAHCNDAPPAGFEAASYAAHLPVSWGRRAGLVPGTELGRLRMGTSLTVVMWDATSPTW